MEAVPSALLTDTDSKLPLGKASHESFYANLFFPIEVKSLGFSLVPKVDFYHERRHQTEVLNPVLNSGNAMNSLSTLATGAFFIKEKTASLPEIVIGESRYTGVSVGGGPGSLWETILGATFEGLYPELGSGKNETFFGVRWRHYPGFDQFLPLIFKRLSFEDGWYFDVQIPTHMYLGWITEDRGWDFFTGPKLSDVQYPHDTSVFQGWMRGTRIDIVLGARRNLAGVFYASLETGIQGDSLTFNRSDGTEALSMKSSFRPVVRFSLQTWFDRAP